MQWIKSHTNEILNFKLYGAFFTECKIIAVAKKKKDSFEIFPVFILMRTHT